MYVLSSIARIAAKRSFDPKLLLDAFTDAWINKESRCEMLSVMRRKVDRDLVTFLITCNDEVIWQFPIKKIMLQKLDFYKSYLPTFVAPIQMKAEDNSVQKDICDLRDKMKGVTVKARIMEVPPGILVNTKYGGEALVSNILG